MTSFMVAAILSEFALADKPVRGPGSRLGGWVSCAALSQRLETPGIRDRQRTEVVSLISEAKVDIVRSFTAGAL